MLFDVGRRSFNDGYASRLYSTCFFTSKKRIVDCYAICLRFSASTDGRESRLRKVWHLYWQFCGRLVELIKPMAKDYLWYIIHMTYRSIASFTTSQPLTLDAVEWTWFWLRWDISSITLNAVYCIMVYTLSNMKFLSIGVTAKCYRVDENKVFYFLATAYTSISSTLKL